MKTKRTLDAAQQFIKLSKIFHMVKKNIYSVKTNGMKYKLDELQPKISYGQDAYLQCQN